jgi:hypothetical protein
MADDAPAWTRMFERATAELDSIDPDDRTQNVSRETRAVVYAAIDLVNGAALDAGRACLSRRCAIVCSSGAPGRMS